MNQGMGDRRFFVPLCLVTPAAVLDTEVVHRYDRANYSDYGNDQTVRDPNVFWEE